MALSSDQLIQELLEEATAQSIAEQRHKQRMPFFRPATMRIPAKDESKEYSVFTRDINSHGIGILHETPPDFDTIALRIPNVTDRCDDLRVSIHWCRDAGQGWYLSGGRFSQLSVQQSIHLLMTAVAKEIALRLKQRYAYFRPATITIIDGDETQQSEGFITDISLDGVGLLHKGPLERGTTIVKLPTRYGHLADVRIDTKWSRPIGSGWYAGGGRFTQMDFGELPGRAT